MFLQEKTARRPKENAEPAGRPLESLVRSPPRCLDAGDVRFCSHDTRGTMDGTGD